MCIAVQVSHVSRQVSGVCSSTSVTCFQAGVRCVVVQVSRVSRQVSGV